MEILVERISLDRFIEWSKYYSVYYSCASVPSHTNLFFNIKGTRYTMVLNLQYLALQSFINILKLFNEYDTVTVEAVNVLVERQQCSPSFLWKTLMHISYGELYSYDLIEKMEWRKCQKCYLSTLDFEKYLDSFFYSDEKLRTNEV